MKTKNLAKQIWKNCFQDTAEETDFYFENIFQEPSFKTYEEEGEVLSSLHANPYSFRLGEHQENYPYIVGVATPPEHRGKSYMTRLLFQEFVNLRKQGLDFCYLTPINPKIYRAFGFEYFSALEEYSLPFSLLEEKIKGKESSIVSITMENISKYAADLTKIYSIAMIPYFSYFTRKELSFQRLFKENLLSNGSCYLFFQHGRPSAYIFFYTEGKELYLRECFATNPGAYEEIFAFLKNFREYYSKLRISAAENLSLEFFLSNQLQVEKKFSPFMMGRILQVKTFLQKCHLIAPEIRIFIEDPVLLENTGFYTLTENVDFSREKIEDYDFHIGIRELVPLCFGFFSFQDLLRLGKIKLHSVEHLEKLQQLFPKKFNYYHEYW